MVSRSSSRSGSVEADASQSLRLMGERLRAGRRRSGLTVAGAARASGLSTGFISLIENGKTDATVGRLTQLVEAYGMSITEIVVDGGDGGEPEPTSEVLGLMADYASPRERLTYRFFDHAGSGVLPVHVTIEPGGGWLDPSVHQGEETIFGLRGRVEVHAGDVVVELGPGDRYRIPPHVPHSLRTLGRQTVELFVLVVDPRPLDRLHAGPIPALRNLTSGS